MPLEAKRFCKGKPSDPAPAPTSAMQMQMQDIGPVTVLYPKIGCKLIHEVQNSLHFGEICRKLAIN